MGWCVELDAVLPWVGHVGHISGSASSMMAASSGTFGRIWSAMARHAALVLNGFALRRLATTNGVNKMLLHITKFLPARNTQNPTTASRSTAPRSWPLPAYGAKAKAITLHLSRC
jgi:hypothetical protein